MGGNIFGKNGHCSNFFPVPTFSRTSWSGSSSNLNLMIFDLYAVVSNFSVKVAHSLMGSFFRCFLYLRRFCLSRLSLDKSESSLEDGYDESSFRCLRHFFFFLLFFFLGAESDDDESDESDDDGSGSRFTLGSCFSLRVELFSDQVI